MFPWAFDRSGCIGRRAVPELPCQDTAPLAVDLGPLHRALDMYASHSESMERRKLVQHHLMLVRAATADASLPFAWREIHYGCNLLLNAPRWHLTAV